MRKCLLSFITLLCIVVHLFAEKGECIRDEDFINVFDAEKTVWTFRHYGSHPPYTEEIRHVVLNGDTVINGVKWKIFTSEPLIPKGLVRAEGDKVFFMVYPGNEQYVSVGHYGKEAMIYDFSLNVGDSIISDFHGASYKEEIVDVL